MLSAAITYAVREWEWRLQNPVLGRMLKEPEGRLRWLTRAQAPIASVKTAFNSACKRVGIADFHFHDLRHTCAAWLVQAGVPLTEVRDVLGHSTIKMTERYAHLAPKNTRAALARLEGGESRLGHAGEEEGGAECA